VGLLCTVCPSNLFDLLLTKANNALFCKTSKMNMDVRVNAIRILMETQKLLLSVCPTSVSSVCVCVRARAREQYLTTL
jgi:hypothetical protein